MSVLQEYLAAGLALVAISNGRKGPSRAGWQLRENAITDPSQLLQIDGNVGLAHAWSTPPTCAIDIDQLDKAGEWLASQDVSLSDLLDAPDAVQIVSGRENRAKLLYRLQDPLQTWQKRDEHGEMVLELRCATADGLSVQDVLPPSIHPDTGKPYEWGGTGDWRNLPELPASLQLFWQRQAQTIRSKANTSALRGALPADEATMADLASALEKIPADDRELWVRMGMALATLHDQDAAHDLFIEWSATSEKFDEADADRVWCSFRPTATSYKAIFAEAQRRGWDNPGQRKCVRTIGSTSTSGTSSPMPASDKPLDVARAIADGPMQNTVRWQGQFYVWRAGAYQTVEDEAIRRIAYQCLEAWSMKAAPRSVSDAVDALRAVTLATARLAPPCWLDGTPAHNLLVFPNGALDLDTGELLPPSPDLFALATLGVEYVDDAPEPVAWLQFLDTLWPDDPESIDALQEIIGYLLTSRTEQQKVFLLIGPKRSGKGTILRILAALLGRDSVAAPTLSSLLQPFGLQALIGKHAALVSDARLSGRADTAGIAERLLSISGEDHVSVARKFLPDYTARLPVRFLLASNELPRLTDSSGALASRFIVLQLRTSFYGHEHTGLTDRLLTELPGILHWALAGLVRLSQRGHFVQPGSADEAVRTMEDIGSPIGAFLRDECTLHPAASVEVDALYGHWVQHCHAAGVAHPSTKEVFCRDLYAAQPGIRQFRGRVGETRRNMLRGVRIAQQVRVGQGDQTLRELHRREVWD